MSLRQNMSVIVLAVASVVYSAGAAENAGGGAAPGKTGGKSAVAAPSNAASANNSPANNSPANNAPANTTPTRSNAPNANSNPGQFNNAAGVQNANDNDRRGANAADRRNERRNRTVYVPSYGYANWNGDYSSPYWNAPGGWYNNQGYSSQQGNNSKDSGVAAPIPSVRPEEEAAQAEMTSSQARLAKQFESSDDVRAALHDVQQAQHAYDAAVAKAKKQIKEDPDFKQAEADKQQAARKVEAVQAADRQKSTPPGTATQPAPISPEILRAAQQKLNAASEVSTITADHAQTDGTVNEAREKLETAADKLNGMKDKFDASLQADPQWQAAKQKLDAARAGSVK